MVVAENAGTILIVFGIVIAIILVVSIIWGTREKREIKKRKAFEEKLKKNDHKNLKGNLESYKKIKDPDAFTNECEYEVVIRYEDEGQIKYAKNSPYVFIFDRELDKLEKMKDFPIRVADDLCEFKVDVSGQNLAKPYQRKKHR